MGSFFLKGSGNSFLILCYYLWGEFIGIEFLLCGKVESVSVIVELVKEWGYEFWLSKVICD